MKLRFEKNSVRFRVRKSDLALLNHQGFVQETVQFPDALFRFQLRVSGEGDPSAQFNGNSITANIPLGMATEWMNTEEVGIYHVQHINNETLEITIEKDFPCKDRPEEDRSDTFIELAENSGKNEVC
ncbi:MAG TPA: hypothetical protein PLA68_08855 [Panacibacter sp.]|nr:hypothetical protein [Panacibacter sp.]